MLVSKRVLVLAALGVVILGCTRKVPANVPEPNYVASPLPPWEPEKASQDPQEVDPFSVDTGGDWVGEAPPNAEAEESSPAESSDEPSVPEATQQPGAPALPEDGLKESSKGDVEHGPPSVPPGSP